MKHFKFHNKVCHQLNSKVVSPSFLCSHQFEPLPASLLNNNLPKARGRCLEIIYSRCGQISNNFLHCSDPRVLSMYITSFDTIMCSRNLCRSDKRKVQCNCSLARIWNTTLLMLDFVPNTCHIKALLYFTRTDYIQCI